MVNTFTVTQALELLRYLSPAHRKKCGGKNAPGFDVRTDLQEWVGVDLTQIGGIDVCTALKVLVELDPDLSKFKTANTFSYGWIYVQERAFQAASVFLARAKESPIGSRSS